jgi:hypothetical protein
MKRHLKGMWLGIIRKQRTASVFSRQPPDVNQQPDPVLKITAVAS